MGKIVLNNKIEKLKFFSVKIGLIKKVKLEILMFFLLLV